MKVKTSAFKTALVKAKKFAWGNKHSAQVQLKGSYGELAVMSTDVDCGSKITISGAGDFNFNGFANIAQLQKIVKTIHHKECDISFVDGYCQVFGQSTESHMDDRRDFGYYDWSDDSHKHSVSQHSGKDLKEFFKRIVTSASNDITRQSLMNVLFCKHNNETKVISTNGHTMSVLHADFPWDYDDIAIPAKFFKDLGKALLAKPEYIVEFSHHCVTVKSANPDRNGMSFEFWCKYSEIKFPTWEGVIPSYSDFGAIITNIESLKTACGFATANSKRDPSAIQFDGRHSCLHAIPAYDDDYNMDILFGEIDDDWEYCYYNPNYIMDMLNVLDCEKIHIRTGGNLDPLICSGCNSTDLYLIMPLRP